MSASALTPLPNLSGAVLAGGLSRRMGQDKALTRIPGTRTMMLDAVLAVLATVTTDVMVVAPRRKGYERSNARLIGDVPGPPGPLRGIAAALTAARHDRCLVLACDLPFADPRLLRWLATQGESADAVIPVTSGRSRQGGNQVFQTLHAIYSRSCLPSIERQLAAGAGGTTRFLDEVNVTFLDEERLRLIDPQLRSFVNVNSADDWPCTLAGGDR